MRHPNLFSERLSVMSESTSRAEITTPSGKSVMRLSRKLRVSGGLCFKLDGHRRLGGPEKKRERERDVRNKRERFVTTKYFV